VVMWVQSCSQAFLFHHVGRKMWSPARSLACSGPGPASASQCHGASLTHKHALSRLKVVCGFACISVVAMFLFKQRHWHPFSSVGWDFNAGTGTLAQVVNLAAHAPTRLAFPNDFEGISGRCPKGFDCGGHARVCENPPRQHTCNHPGVGKLSGKQYLTVGNDFGTAHAQSRVFYMPTEINTIDLLYAGGAHLESGFYVHLFEDDRVICHISSGDETNVFKRYQCNNLIEYQKKPVYICVMDNQKSHWGKVLIDDIHFKDQFGVDLDLGDAKPMVGQQSMPDCTKIHTNIVTA